MQNISAFLLCLPLFSYSFMQSQNNILLTRPKINSNPLFNDLVETKSLDESIKDKYQIEAITSEAASILIVAGAGSGKTRVLSARLANLLKKGICNPREILILSSTNNAAHNLKTRADHLLSGTVATTAGVCCHTFHGFCSTVIRKHYSDMLIQKQLIVADDNDQIDIMLRILNQTNETPNILLASNLLKKIRYWKELGLSYSTVKISTLKTGVERQAYQLFPEYQKQLKYVSALDYGDMLVMTLQLFRSNTQLLQYFRTTSKHILIDEFQDISPVQYEILRYLSVGPTTKRDKSLGVPRTTNKAKQALVNVFCAGDDDQSIYSWRGANIALMRRFPYDFPQAIATHFDYSYRVPEAVVRAAQAVISNVNDRIAKSCEAFSMENEEEEESSPTSAQRASLEVWRALTVETEINWLCTYIANVTNIFLDPSGSSTSSSGSSSSSSSSSSRSSSDSNSYSNGNIRTVSPGSVNKLPPGSSSVTPTLSDKYRKYSIAVLVRTQEDLKRVADNLEDCNISFRTRGYFTKLLPLFFGAEAGCILNLIRLLSFPYNDVAFQAALDNDILTSRYPYKAIIMNILPTIRAFAVENNKSLLEASRECVLKDKLTSRYSNAMNAFLLKYFKWQDQINSEYQKGSLGHAILMDIMKQAYSIRWSEGMAGAANDICESASHFDSLQQFITVIRQEGEYMINEEVIVSGRDSGSGSGSKDDSGTATATATAPPTSPAAPRLSSSTQRRWSSLTEHCRESFEMKGRERELTNIDINRDMPDMNVYRKMRSQVTTLPPATVSAPTSPTESLDVGKSNTWSSSPDKRQTSSSPGSSSSGSSSPGSSSSSPSSVSVWVMTMHAAKGLEFDEVLLPFWTDDNIPKLPSIEEVTSPSSSPLEDERRLVYVALTRARDRVVITYASKDKAAAGGADTAFASDTSAVTDVAGKAEVGSRKGTPQPASRTLTRSPFLDDILSASTPKTKVRIISKESCIFPIRRSGTTGTTTVTTNTNKPKSGKINSKAKDISN